MEPHPDLVNAIRDRQNRQIPEADIRQEVLLAGHSEAAYEAALHSIQALDTPGSTSVSGSELISYPALLRETWQLLVTQMPVLCKTIAAGLLSLAVLFVIMEVVRVFTGVEDQTLTYVIWSVFPVAISVLLSFTLMRALLKRADNQSYGSHLAFILRQSWPLTVTVLAATCAVMTGYMFFIIPGLILMIYTWSAIFFALDGRGRGIEALVLSTAATHGRFWSVVGRVIAIGFVFMVVMLGGIFLSVLTFILAPVLIAVLLFVGYFALYASYVVLYESVRDAGTIKPLPLSPVTLTRIYAGVTIAWVAIAVCFLALGTGGALLLFTNS